MSVRVFVEGGGQGRSENPGTAVLLVDSEGPVASGDRPWDHLQKQDRWTTPENTVDRAHLMVQCMESWFIADADALAAFYGPDFNRNPLPANPRIEDVAKNDVMAGLRHATRPTSKGEYHKTHHGFAILERIDPRKVSKCSPHAKALFDVLGG